MSPLRAVVSLLAFFLRLLNPFAWVGWAVENFKTLCVISFLVNITLLPLLAYIVVTDSVNAFAQLVGRALGSFLQTCPDVKNMQDLWALFEQFSVWVLTSVMDFRVVDAWHTICFCYLLRKQAAGLIGYLPERAMPGSPYVNADSLPGFQASIFELIDGAWREVGQCFRVGQVLLTAGHVVKAGAQRLRIQANRGMLEITQDRFLIVDEYTDLAYAILDDREFTKLGLSKARLIPAGADGYSISFASAQTSVERTTGNVQMALSGSNKLFGYVRYTGSTRPGYSGAPYYMANNVYGMHLGASAENIGYDAAYITMKIRNLQESSHDFFEKLVENARGRGKKLLVRSTGDPDIVEVFVRGHYARFDRDEVADIMEELPGSITFDDESGNGRRPSASALGRGLKVTSVSVQNHNSPASASTQGLQQSAEEARTTVPRERTRARSSSPSPSTSKSGNNKKEGLSRLVTPSNRFLTILSELSRPGASAPSEEDRRLLAQFVSLNFVQSQATASSPDSAPPTVRS